MEKNMLSKYNAWKLEIMMACLTCITEEKKEIIPSL